MKTLIHLRISLCVCLCFAPLGLSAPVHFLVTGDPQFDNGKNNQVPYNTFRQMALKKLSDRSIRGIVVAGDLTQNTRPYDEYAFYTESLENIPDSNLVDALEFTYDGIGNHDLNEPSTLQSIACWFNADACVSPQFIKNELVSRARETQPFRRAGIHYAWKWDGVTFIHLNLFPGNSPGWGGLSPENSLEFLHSVLSGLDSKNDRIIIIHHYGFDPFSMGILPNKEIWWSEAQRVQYWNEISSFKVLGIFTGHLHCKPGQRFEYDFQRPGAVSTGPKSIPAFTSGATLNGVYLDVTINSDTLHVRQMQSDGTQLGQTSTVP